MVKLIEKERHIDWFRFKKSILKTENKAMLYVIYRMTVIYNTNTGIITKIIFKIEIKFLKKKESNNSCLIGFVSTPFPLICITLSDWNSLITPWMNHKNKSVPMRWAGSGECSGARRAVLMWHFAISEVGVISIGLDYNLNGTFTDWNLYWIMSGELQTSNTEQLKMFQTDVQSQEQCLTE